MKESEAQNWQERMEAWRSELPEGGQGDRLIRFFIFARILLDSGRGGKKRAEKEYRLLRGSELIEEILTQGPGEGLNALRTLCLDSARRYFRTSLNDPSYSSKFFHLLRMRPEEVLDKIQNEVENRLIPFLRTLPEEGLRDSLICALETAYRELREAKEV